MDENESYLLEKNDSNGIILFIIEVCNIALKFSNFALCTPLALRKRWLEIFLKHRCGGKTKT